MCVFYPWLLSRSVSSELENSWPQVYKQEGWVDPFKFKAVCCRIGALMCLASVLVHKTKTVVMAISPCITCML